MAREEISEVRRVPRDLRELPAAGLRRAFDQRLAHEQPGRDRRRRPADRARQQTTVPRPADGVGEHERDRAESEVNLS